MASRDYQVVLSREQDGGYSVTVPALPGCASQGATREEALAMIREAIEGYLDSLAAHNDPLPDPVEIERVSVSGWAHACRPSRHDGSCGRLSVAAGSLTGRRAATRSSAIPTTPAG